MTENNQDYEIEYTDEVEYLNALCNVLDVMDKVDVMIMPKGAEGQKKRIIRNGLAIIDKIVGNIYKEYFEGEE